VGLVGLMEGWVDGWPVGCLDGWPVGEVGLPRIRLGYG
jgi:hypothetical protein